MDQQFNIFEDIKKNLRENRENRVKFHETTVEDEKKMIAIDNICREDLLKGILENENFLNEKPSRVIPPNDWEIKQRNLKPDN